MLPDEIESSAAWEACRAQIKSEIEKFKSANSGQPHGGKFDYEYTIEELFDQTKSIWIECLIHGIAEHEFALLDGTAEINRRLMGYYLDRLDDLDERPRTWDEFTRTYTYKRQWSEYVPRHHRLGSLGKIKSALDVLRIRLMLILKCRL
jgi:hypothetical protein